VGEGHRDRHAAEDVHRHRGPSSSAPSRRRHRADGQPYPGNPADPFRTEIRDPHSGFIAYVPPGSIARGEALVKGGASGKTVQCALCHGETLKGLGEVPRLAGLQPLYVARQLYDMRHGSSAGKAAALMKPVVANLSDDDIIAISSYLGSLPPQ